MKIPRDKILLSFSKYEWDLISEHSFPSFEIQEALASVEKSSKEIEIECDGFDVEQLLGDLARSTNACSDPTLTDRLDRLYERIESETKI